MASLQDRVKAVAQALITAVSMTHAVMATDINAQARALHKDFGQYSQADIASRIASEIKQNHKPGISGSL